MLSRIGLERLCLVLVAVMTAEVGYLWRAYTTPVQRQVVVMEPVAGAAPEQAPLIALAPEPHGVAPQAMPAPPAAALPRRRERAGRTEEAAPRPGALEDCAHSNDPL